MIDTDPKEAAEMECSMEGCPGEYEEGAMGHTVRSHGEVVLIEHISAEVCSVCGDVPLRPETVRRIEAVLRSPCKSDAS